MVIILLFYVRALFLADLETCRHAKPYRRFSNSQYCSSRRIVSDTFLRLTDKIMTDESQSNSRNNVHDMEIDTLEVKCKGNYNRANLAKSIKQDLSYKLYAKKNVEYKVSASTVVTGVTIFGLSFEQLERNVSFYYSFFKTPHICDAYSLTELKVLLKITDQTRKKKPRLVFCYADASKYLLATNLCVLCLK